MNKHPYYEILTAIANGETQFEAKTADGAWVRHSVERVLVSVTHFGDDKEYYQPDELRVKPKPTTFKIGDVEVSTPVYELEHGTTYYAVNTMVSNATQYEYTGQEWLKQAAKSGFVHKNLLAATIHLGAITQLSSQK